MYSNHTDPPAFQRKLFARSDRVKAVDFHPTEPWVLTGLYNGSVNIYNHQTGALIRTFEVAQLPVRCCRFIPRKNWFVAGSDDFQLRVFNYNTHDKIIAFEAHPDYIRCLAVHPTLPIVLTASDDMSIKAWDWDKAWKNTQVRRPADLSDPLADRLVYRIFAENNLDISRTYALHYESGGQSQGSEHFRISLSR